MEGHEEGLTTYSEIFERLCPQYMSIGMSYSEFWDGDVSAVRAYREAQELREKQKNRELWLAGLYTYEALCDASALFRFTMKKGSIKPEPYPSQPFPIGEEEVVAAERRREEQMKAEFAAYAERMMKKMSSETR